MYQVSLFFAVGFLCSFLFPAESALYSMQLSDFDSDHYCAAYLSYKATNKGRASLNFLTSLDSFLIHVNPRYRSDQSWSCWNAGSAMVINDMQNGAWQTEVRPSGFSFLMNADTTMIIEPKQANYDIGFTVAGDKDYDFTFPYRNGNNPQNCREVRAYNTPECGSLPTLYNFGMGHCTSLSTGSIVRVSGITAASNNNQVMHGGDITIDVSLGSPQDKAKSNVALRVSMSFQSDTISLQNIVNGVTSTGITKSNPVARGVSFTATIEVLETAYKVTVGSAEIGSFPRLSCSNEGTSTVWVSGVATLTSIETDN